ncbi:cysteine-rich venom protein-like [Anomaloglossus baeobatrachus]|uniref:cysteine-rich venom protein-like n=1 Tax=Anomaloglossus baeobatrachus TaxID=238106 RepID=UPI003F5077E3
MKLRFANLLMLILLQGQISSIFSVPDNENENSAVFFSSEDIDEKHTNEAFMPPCEDNDYVKHKRSLRKRAAGRNVDIAAEIVESMANTPFSALSCNLPAIQNEILDVHNAYRRTAVPCAKNMLKLTWNSDAAKLADNWAKQCKEGHSDANSRRIKNLRCGENTFMCKYKVPWTTVVNSWHSEGGDYKYGFGPTSNVEIGHYTAMMWATSGAIGCSVAECDNDNFSYVYVCTLCPAGNKGSRLWPWKDGKACDDCPNSCENGLCTNPCPYEDPYSNCPSLQSNCNIDPTLPANCPATCMCTKGEIK